MVKDQLPLSESIIKQIHSFIDGNGRTGRLLVTWLKLPKTAKIYCEMRNLAGFIADNVIY
nr:Fic family protein [Mordavella massiliensis]